MSSVLLSSSLAMAEDYISHMDPIHHHSCKYGNSTIALEL